MSNWTKIAISTLLLALSFMFITPLLAQPEEDPPEEEEPIQARPRPETLVMPGAVGQGVRLAVPRPYTRQLMSDAELKRYNARMRGITDLRERNEFRLRIHKAMQNRATEMGMTIASSPPDWAYCAGSGCLGHGMMQREGITDQTGRAKSGVKPQPKPDAIPINIP